MLTALSSLRPGRQPLRFTGLLLGAPEPAGESWSPGGVGGPGGHGRALGTVSGSGCSPPRGGMLGLTHLGGDHPPMGPGDETGWGCPCFLWGWMGQFLDEEPTQPLWRLLARAQLRVPGTGTDRGLSEAAAGGGIGAVLPLPPQEQPDRGRRQPAEHRHSQQGGERPSRPPRQRPVGLGEPGLPRPPSRSPLSPSPQYLRKKNAELEERYRETTVPKPAYW